MTLNKLELELNSLAPSELFFKNNYLNNRPIFKKSGQILDANKINELNDFISKMMIKRGQLYSKAGVDSYSGENSHSGVASYAGMDTYMGAESYADADTYMGAESNSDVSVSKVSRYLDLSQTNEMVNVFYVHSGDMNMSIEGADYYLGRGNVLILSPYITHQCAVNDDNTVVLNLAIRESTFRAIFATIMEDGGALSEFCIQMLYDKKNTPFIIAKCLPDEILKNDLLEIMMLQRDNGIYRSVLMNNLADHFIITLFSHYSNDMTIHSYNKKSNLLVSNILDYINENYATVTLKDVSEKFSYSTKHISRMLSQVLGTNYLQIITDIRLNKANELLKNTKLSVENISNLIGYSNSRHLRYLFKKKFGVSPSRYAYK